MATIWEAPVPAGPAGPAGPDDGEDAAAAARSSRRAAHVADTRRALLDSARALFGEQGFQATRTEEIVRRAGLTRGALYHHFAGKEDLFRAVFRELSDEVAQSLLRRSTERDGLDAWSRFRANSEVYLEAASRNRHYRQVVLIDGPAVLGEEAWQGWHGPIDKIAEYVREAVGDGVLEPQPEDALAHLLSALGTGGVMYVARADDPGAARDEVARCTERLLAGLAADDRPSTG